MKVRIIILALCTLVMLGLIIMRYSSSYEVDIILILAVTVCVILIISNLTDYPSFKIEGTYLAVKYPFKKMIYHDLFKIEKWKVISFTVRGQQLNTIVISVAYNTVKLYEKDNPEEYKKILKLLQSSYPERRVKL